MLELGIVGAVISVVYNLVKSKFSAVNSKIAIVVISLIAGGVYVLLERYGFWESAVAVLASASAVYALFLKK